MKKVLVTVAALGLVAGVASTASAVEWKMSGKYMVEGAYLSDAKGTGMDLTDDVTNDLNTSDAYFLHTFETNVGMKVNDKISMNAVVRLADDTFWGSQTGGDTAGGNNMATDSTADVYVHQLYMDYVSPIGKARFGRTPAGGYGTTYMDFDKRADRIMLWPVGLDKPWSTLFYVEKVKDKDVAANTVSDEDSTTYVARLYYNTDSTDAGIHYGYTNDQNTDNTIADRKQQLTAYGKFKMDNYFMNAELTHFFGEQDNDTDASDRDYDSWAGMLQVGGKFNNLTVSGTYFYASGDDENIAGNDVENALGTSGTGDLYEPLYVLTGRHTGMLNNDLFSANTAQMSTAGVEAFVLAADYKVSDALTVHGAIGYAKANEENQYSNAAHTAYTYGFAGHDDEYGWEYDLGAAYKLLDNLTYEAHFGYLDTGDFFKTSATSQTENVYVLSHSLTMTF